jgi:hypothetical protein
MGQYDFNSLYGQADSSIFVYDAGEVDAVVESSTWGKTKAGDKGQWDVRFRVTTGPNAGRAQVRFPMTITADNPQALGIMFRHLEAMGIPEAWIKTNPPEEQIAQAMVGKPVLIRIVLDEYEGVQRNKVRDVRPPRPGAPTTWPTFQQPQAPAAMPGYGPMQQQMGFNGGMPQFPPQQAPQSQPAYGQYPQPQPGYGQAPTAYVQPQPDYSQPSYAQPPQPDPWATPQPQQPYGGPQQPVAAPAPVDPWQQLEGVPAANGGQPGGSAVPPWAQPPVPEQQPWNPMQQPQQAPQPGYGAAPAPFPQQPQQPAAPAPGNAPWNGQAPSQQPEQGGPQGAPQPPWAQ